jgi:SAM-dependent methyltransferase
MLTDRPSVTILDLDRAVDVARQRLADLLPSPRLELLVGDALTLTTERAYDIVMVNDLLHYFDGERQQQILARAARALRDDGMIVISKFRLSADGTEPTQASLFSLKMYVNTLSGYLPTDQETVDQLRALDLHSIQLLNFGADKTVVVGCR